MVSPETVRAYKIGERMFREYCDTQGVPDAIGDFKQLLSRWVETLQNLSAGTHNLRLQGVRSAIFRDLIIPEEIKTQEYHHKDPFTLKELRDTYHMLMAGDDHMRLLGTLLRFLVVTGLRKGTLVHMNWCDVQERYGDEYRIVSYAGKGDHGQKTSKVPITIREYQLLKNELGPYVNGNGKHLIFTSQSTETISGVTINTYFNLGGDNTIVGLAKDRGILGKEKFITPHSTRVTTMHLIERYGEGIGSQTKKLFLGYRITDIDRAYSYLNDTTTIADLLTRLFDHDEVGQDKFG